MREGGRVSGKVALIPANTAPFTSKAPWPSGPAAKPPMPMCPTGLSTRKASRLDGLFMGHQVDNAVGDNGVRTGAHPFCIARACFNSAPMNCKAAVSSSGCGDTSAVAPPVSVLLAFTSEHLMFQLIQLYP